MVTIDIPGAFLHADNEDYVIMKMVGTLAELMIKTNPKDVPTVCDIRERKVRALSTPAEGAIRHDEERAAILQKISIGTMRDGIYYKPIRSMCCKQDSIWDTNDD